jgi:hypothetical protein
MGQENRPKVPFLKGELIIIKKCGKALNIRLMFIYFIGKRSRLSKS